MRRLVLNDGAPEVDGVGLARLRLAAQRWSVPNDWDEAASRMREERGSRYPGVSADEWSQLARLHWHDGSGETDAPRDGIHGEVLAHFANIDTDDAYPTMWREFAALIETPCLLVRGENSDMVSEATVARMRELHPKLKVAQADGQGSPPHLHLGDVPEKVASFLAEH